MAEQGIYKINSLKQKWVGYQILADLVLAATCAIILFRLWFLANIVKVFFIPNTRHLLLLFILLAIVIIVIHRPWQLSKKSLAVFLDQTYPQLQDSTELILKSPTELTLLQKLQLGKVEDAINNVPSLPKQFIKRLKIAVVCLVVYIAIDCLLAFIPITHVTGDLILPPTSTVKAEQILPQIDAVDVAITPPSYTGKPLHNQDKFTILAEEGSSANWRITTNIAIKQLSLLFNDREQIPLKPNTDKTIWIAVKTIDKPGFYQVNIDGKLSDLYQVETIKDNAPQIHIKTPKQYTYIDAGEKPQVNLTTTITDDYGVSDALIYATIAKGSGEGVKFKEYKIPFENGFGAHSKSYDLRHLFELPKLNMEPGDELYFYIEAHDNHQQKSRTDVFTVSIQDTAALLSMDGIVNGSNLKPEYFRSQRQIIMDTEKLLKGRDSMNKTTFNNTAGDIGIDQKMLRLRYGKFLGEEDESKIGGAEDNSELAKVENFNNAAMILDAQTDKHDNAEDATFLEPAIKAQLRATLTEMWKAELHLRMYKPEEALPFEYKALRLLKDLQQKSRSYVAKTAYKPTPLKPEKRLSGDLSKINQPLNKQSLKPAADGFTNLKNAVQLLEQAKITRRYSNADKHILQLAKQQLSLKASAQPGIYLSAVSALSRIISATEPNLTDIGLVERAIQKMLPPIALVPQSSALAPDMGLSQRYYQNLKSR